MDALAEDTGVTEGGRGNLSPYVPPFRKQLTSAKKAMFSFCFCLHQNSTEKSNKFSVKTFFGNLRN